MLEVFVKFICFVIMAVTGFYVIKNIIQSDVKICSKRTTFYLLLLVFIQIVLYKAQYSISYTIIVFLLNIIIYKIIFKMKLEESIVSCSMFTVILFVSDLIISLFLRNFYTAQEIREIYYVYLLSHLLITMICFIILKTKVIYNQLQKFYNNMRKKRLISNIVFFGAIILEFIIVASELITTRNYNINYFADVIAMILFTLITYIFVQNKNNYNQLSDEYDNLFSYIQNFEDWIEKEQLNRHEYKNQLAVLRCLTKEKRVKNKIDEILEDNIKLEGEVVNQLKCLPKGGLKGLMYYKSAIAQKNKIKLTVNVSIESKSLLSKLSEAQNKDLCKLIGIYYDNAIEAALETKKKIILVEVYELKDKVNIVISNTFIKKKNFSTRNEKGVTTKGEGRGNGLFFAKNILSKNKWIITKQEIIDNYYIQTLSILKKKDT